MEQAKHFLEESEALYDVLDELSDNDFDHLTLFKNWTINDILVHLHFWNKGADLALQNSEAFIAMFEKVYADMQTGNLRQHENSKIPERGKALLNLWSEYYRDMGKRWQEIDPKTRVKWVGPDMSARTSISARQMETWAHGQAIFDLLSLERQDTDRIRNIVMLGVNAFGWTHKVHGLDVPEQMPHLKLNAPSGEVWEFGEAQNEETISGSAVEFAQVVTQTRNILDTQLAVKGAVAKQWMEHAQCFAGAAETPPAPGLRRKA